MTSIDDIRDAAQRALTVAQTRIADAIEAKLTWTFRPTMSNAIQRDFAKDRAEGWEDVETIATWVLDRTIPSEQAAAVRQEREESPMIVLGPATVCVLLPDPEREALNDQIKRYVDALDGERETSGRMRRGIEHLERVIRSLRERHAILIRDKNLQITALTNDAQALAEAFEQSQRDLTSAREYGIRRDREIERLIEDSDRLTALLADAEQSATAWHRIAEEYRAEAVMAEGVLKTIAEEAESLNVALSSDPLISWRTARTRVQNIHGLAVSVEVNRGT